MLPPSRFALFHPPLGLLEGLLLFFAKIMQGLSLFDNFAVAPAFFPPIKAGDNDPVQVAIQQGHGEAQVTAGILERVVANHAHAGHRQLELFLNFIQALHRLLLPPLPLLDELAMAAEQAFQVESVKPHHELVIALLKGQSQGQRCCGQGDADEHNSSHRQPQNAGILLQPLSH